MKLKKLDLIVPVGKACCAFHKQARALKINLSVANFLCKKDWQLFVSMVDITEPDWSLPRNCKKKGCVYFDPENKSGLIPFDLLDEIYWIQGGDCE